MAEFVAPQKDKVAADILIAAIANQRLKVPSGHQVYTPEELAKAFTTIRQAVQGG